MNWLNPPDQSPLETTIGFEQVAIEVTASVAQHEPDEYLAQVFRFGLLEDFDHMYRYSALMDRVEGKDANNLLQSYTDVRPGRPTSVEHRVQIADRIYKLLTEEVGFSPTDIVYDPNILTVATGIEEPFFETQNRAAPRTKTNIEAPSAPSWITRSPRPK